MNKKLKARARNVLGAAVLATVTLLPLSAPALTLTASSAPATSHTGPALETGCCA